MLPRFADRARPAVVVGDPGKLSAQPGPRQQARGGPGPSRGELPCRSARCGLEFRDEKRYFTEYQYDEVVCIGVIFGNFTPMEISLSKAEVRRQWDKEENSWMFWFADIALYQSGRGPVVFHCLPGLRRDRDYTSNGSMSRAFS